MSDKTKKHNLNGIGEKTEETKVKTTKKDNKTEKD